MQYDLSLMTKQPKYAQSSGVKHTMKWKKTFKINITHFLQTNHGDNSATKQ